MNYEMMKAMMESRQDNDTSRAAGHLSAEHGHLIQAKKVNPSYAPALALVRLLLAYDLATLRLARR